MGRSLVLIVLILIYAGAINSAYAISGDNILVPMVRPGMTAFSKQSGLQLRVDSTWAGNRGYRPVRVTVSMAKPATADTQITINFHAGGWRNNHKGISVEHDFELVQGLASTTATFVVPQYAEWSTYGWEVWVDGVLDEMLCLPAAGFNSGNSGALAIGVMLTNQRRAAPQQLLGMVTSTPEAQLLSSVASNAIEAQPLESANLPATWTAYSPLDSIAASMRALETARVTSPKKFAELLRWVRAGGNLWVIDMGQDFEKLPALEEVLTPTSADDPEAQVTALSAWHHLKLNSEGRKRLDDLITLTMESADEDNELSRADIRDSVNPNRAIDSRQWFVARAYGLGTIVALQNNNKVGRFGGGDAAVALRRTSMLENLEWANRHGNDPGAGNPNFNNLLIPDVGTAPVFEFQMLITLFVIGIGPVNYWLLKRRNKLPVLLVTVPLAAIVATLMLFTYGILSDGIGVRVRARSVTLLDQQAGEIASWARLSYYAGIAPSDGLNMPTDTVVYPILPSRSQYNSFGRRYSNQERSVDWGQQQQLTRGWLASRTPTQYLALTARPTKKQLLFDEQMDELSVTNQLGTEVLAVFAQDHQGNVFLGEQVTTDGTLKLEPSNYSQAISKLRLFLTENLPELPAGYVQNKNTRRGDYNPPLSDSLLEVQLEAMVSPTASGWGDGTYIAITSTGVAIPLGVEDVTETSSFHVVRGTW